ncbi:MAG TPA: response regulator, partial [Noviherbaspirillum sp.]
LALVKSLVELHGGHVTARSDGVGKGSQFIICLPQLIEDSDLSDKEFHLSKNIAATRALKVMVVDDNVDAAELLALLIETFGHRVVVEHDSMRAIERARLEKPDAFLLDIGLPDMDGNELARRLRELPETANATFIAVTGYGQEQDRINASIAGFDHHIVKPVAAEKIANVLSSIGLR